MEVQDRLKIAGKLIPALDMGRRMGMNSNILERMLMQSMDRAEDLRATAVAKGKPALTGGQALASAFDQLQYAHGGFHEFYHETRKAVENEPPVVAMARGRAMNAENEWRDQGPEIRKCLGFLNDARRNANGLTEQTVAEIKHFEAVTFVNAAGEKNTSGKRLRVA